MSGGGALDHPACTGLQELVLCADLPLAAEFVEQVPGFLRVIPGDLPTIGGLDDASVDAKVVQVESDDAVVVLQTQLLRLLEDSGGDLVVGGAKDPVDLLIDVPWLAARRPGAFLSMAAGSDLGVLHEVGPARGLPAGRAICRRPGGIRRG